jgi:hypothetical protein
MLYPARVRVDLLRRFQARNVDVRPGDALLCMVAMTHLYGHDNELIGEQYTITQVINVLADRVAAQELPFGGDNHAEG